MTPLIIKENAFRKIVASENYNFGFNKKNGRFARWGKTYQDDPDFAPSPELLDIEVTTICNGIVNSAGIQAPCKFCYKGNTKIGKNMSFETFQKILDSMFWLNSNEVFETLVCQIAFGADAQATSNPDLWRMMEYTRSRGVVPNITVADISDETADKLIKYCGAVAVSRYANKDICYNSIKKLTDRGLTQCNIHMMVSEETFDMCLETIRDRLSDPRLAKLNAIVFLSLKQKGRGVNFHPLSKEKYKRLVDLAMESKIGFGMDSCSAWKFLQSIKDHPNFNAINQTVEPCESSLFSAFIDVEGNFYPCSFAPGTIAPLDATKEDFRKLWNHQQTEAFRQHLLKTAKNNPRGCRECPLFEV